MEGRTFTTSDKNIVGVGPQCNGFEVIDLGVMVPWQDILQSANDNQADMIGLSGLIHPSLDEMVTVAEEMQRAGMKMPLLIGGATTSKVHTALRIDPAYQGPVLHVLDASRAVGVATALVSDTGRDAYVQGYKQDYAHVRDVRAGKGQSVLLSIEEARANYYDAYLSDKPAPPLQPGLNGLTTGRSRICASASTGRPSSARGNFTALTRRSSTTRWSAKPRRH